MKSETVSSQNKINWFGARNCQTIQQVLIFKFAFGPENMFPGVSRSWPQGR